MTRDDVVIVGGGLGGLATAVYLARAGRRVRVFEKARELGGRARTASARGYRLNLGPHALYRAGHARAVLAELGVAWTGGKTVGKGGVAVRSGRAHTLPIGFLSMMTTGLLPLGDKLSVARLLARIPRMDPAPLEGVSLAAWIEAQDLGEAGAELIAAVVRVATYTNAPALLDAGQALRQVQRAIEGVYYLDGGWQTLVDGLHAAAVAAGAHIETGARVDSLDGFGNAEVVLAVDPATAGRLTREDFGPLVPVRAACLDLALDGLPRPRTSFALGIDVPLYLSVHTRYAELAPEGGAVVQVAKYLAPNQTHDARADRCELEGMMDLVQPGWRDRTVEARFLPEMTVMESIRGTRPALVHGGVHLVGDWLAGDGMLADAVLASARAAAARIAGDLAMGRAA